MWRNLPDPFQPGSHSHPLERKFIQSRPTLCDPMNCSPPGSSVRGIPQARILEWVAMPSTRGSSQPRDQIHISYVPQVGSLPLAPSGKSLCIIYLIKYFLMLIKIKPIQHATLSSRKENINGENFGNFFCVCCRYET